MGARLARVSMTRRWPLPYEQSVVLRGGAGTWESRTFSLQMIPQAALQIRLLVAASVLRSSLLASRKTSGFPEPTDQLFSADFTNTKMSPVLPATAKQPRPGTKQPSAPQKTFLNALEEDIMLHQRLIYQMRNRKQTEMVGPGPAPPCTNTLNTHPCTNFVKTWAAVRDGRRAVTFVLLLGAAWIAPSALHSQTQAPGTSTPAQTPGSSGSGRAAPAAPQIFFASAQRMVGSGLNQPNGVAVDSAGNIFIADTYNSRVVKVAQGGAQTTVGSGLNQPSGVAVDAAGDVFIADTGNGRVVKVPAGGGAQIALSAGFTSPVGVAVDQAGDVLVADSANTRVVLIPANPLIAVGLLGSGLNHPTGVAVDGAGDVFIADSGNNRVVKLGPSGQTTVPATGLSVPWGVAVDGAGDVFIANAGNNSVVEIQAGSGTQSTVGSGLNQSAGVAVDGAGDIFIADSGNNRALEVQRTVSVNFGSANVCPSGQAIPVPCSQTVTLNYNVASSGALQNVNLLTGGAPNLDFTLASSTCAGELEAGSSCAANVTFAPRAPGARMGAVQLIYAYDGQPSVIASTLVYGQGQGPAIAFGPGVPITVPTTGLSIPWGVAVDGAGDLFVADSANSDVIEVPAGGGAQITLGSGLNSPQGLAVDGAGDLFIADAGNNRVVEVPAGGGAQITVGSGLSGPTTVAVDGTGDVFIADLGNNRVVEVPAGGGPQIALGSGLNQPIGVAVDGAGNVFISDFGNNRVVELPAGGGAQTTVGVDVQYPYGVAVDPVGDLFIADFGNSRVVEVPVGGGAQTTLGYATFSIALDGGGNLFLGDLSRTRILEVQRSLPPILTFSSTAVGSTSSPQAITIENIGNQPLNAMAPGLNIGANFQQAPGTGTPADCSNTFSLTPGGSCNLSISFAPQTGGNLQSTAVLTDDALNAAAATQTISLSGTATGGTPVASLSTTALSFGIQNVGSASTSQTVTLSNTGSAALLIASINISGNFAATNNCGSSIAQGKSCQIGVIFTPQSTGALAGTLTVTDNNNGTAGSIQMVSLTGTGAANPYDSAISVTLASTNLVYPGATNIVVGVAGNGGKTATGSVTIYDGTTPLTTLTLATDGKAYWYIAPGLSTGTHLVSASYSGDSNNPAGQSAAVTMTVSPVPVDMGVSCWNASFPYGGNYSCTVNVSSNAGSALGAITYAFDNNAPVSVSLSSGNAQFTLNNTPNVGGHTVAISYVQQGNFGASGTNAQSFTVTQAPTQIQLTPSSWYLAAGSPLTLSASLASWSAGPPTSGTVTFLDNGTAIGTANVDAQGQTSFPIPSIASGSHSYVAQFGGLQNFAAVTSTAVSVTAN